MFLRCKTRKKDGKTHRYWSVVENCRRKGGGMVQRHVLYLGEINASQRALVWLSNAGITNVYTHDKAEDALRSAAYTYVVAALGSLATLLYYIMIFLGGRSRD